MARYDDSQPYTCDYDDDCASCGEEFPRGELAWHAGELECAECEAMRERNAASLQEWDTSGRDCDGIRQGDA